MKKIRLICLLLGILMLLSSCQSVYDVELTAPETTANPEIDLSGEYYTTGIPYFTGDIYEGMIYEGCLLYIETIDSIGIVGERTTSDGEKVPQYGNVQIERVVKYNPVTGTVSSPCLDPSCNHSQESGCPMLLGYGMRNRESYLIKGVFGDWLIYHITKSDNEYSILTTEIMYNLKTGECRRIFADDLGSEILSRWTSGVYHDGKYFKVNSIMDFSNTGYKPGSGQSISDFEPETKRYVYVYDFDRNESKELYKINPDWSLGKVSNERLYFRDVNGKYLSIKKDGTDEREEAALGVSNTVGTFTLFYNSDGYRVHDLKTDEIKDVTFDYSLVGVVNVTEKGVLSAMQTKYDEWENFPFGKYRKEHPNLTSEEINNEARKILASGTAQIWQCGYMGEDNQVIFELPAGRIEVISAYGDYIFAKVSKYDTETGKHLEGYDNRTCSINVKTDEITPIPQLDIVVPYWYEN